MELWQETELGSVTWMTYGCGNATHVGILVPPTPDKLEMVVVPVSWIVQGLMQRYWHRCAA